AQASKAVPTGMAAVIGGVQDDVLAAIEAAGLQPANVTTVSILSNRDGRPVENGREYVQSLVSQVTSPVRWDLCQQTLVEAGVTGLLELLPGGTLTGIARRGMKGVETFALTSADQLDEAR
ncbi:ACP S-malonyltransferase, partial [Brevibacterium paucivorans]